MRFTGERMCKVWTHTGTPVQNHVLRTSQDHGQRLFLLDECLRLVGISVPKRREII